MHHLFMNNNPRPRPTPRSNEPSKWEPSYNEKIKIIDFLSAAGYVVAIGGFFSSVSAVRKDKDLVDQFIPLGAILVGEGIIYTLIYKMEVSMYGFSPSIRSLNRLVGRK